MKTTTVIALSLMFGLINLSPVNAQSSEEDPFAGLEDFFSELESLESEGGEEFADTENNSESSSSFETDSFMAESDTLLSSADESADEVISESAPEASNTVTTEAEAVISTVPFRGNLGSVRLNNGAAPEGKESHVLYNIPGAIEYNGMTFLNIDSRKFFNRFQKCDIAETETVTNALSRLKISQGAPLACREDMQYKFLPYKNFRSTR